MTRPLPYKVATLLYCFNERDEVLLQERAHEPNLGLWSPAGGKLHTGIGESPYGCACREAQEEMGLCLAPKDLRLAGLVSEDGYAGQSHWLMFLFEVKPRLRSLPPPCREGRFEFFSRQALAALQVPQTDRESIWPWFWQYRGGFFAAHCHCRTDGGDEWVLQETRGATYLGEEAPAYGSDDCRSMPLDPPPSTPAPPPSIPSDGYFMGEALRQAARAYKAEEVPVGAVVVRDRRIIARAFNQVELLKDATAHAEMLALTQAEEAAGDWRLADCTLYVTKEPCPMCAGAIVHARLARVVFGAADPRAGAAGSAMNLLQFPSLNHQCATTGGVREAECRALLQNFFAEERRRRLPRPGPKVRAAG